MIRKNILIVPCLFILFTGCAKKLSYYAMPAPEVSSKLRVQNQTNLLLNVQPWSESKNCRGPLLVFPSTSNINFVPAKGETEYTISGGKELSLLVAATSGIAQCTFYLTFFPEIKKDYQLSFSESENENVCYVSMTERGRDGNANEISLKRRVGKIPFSDGGEWCE